MKTKCWWTVKTQLKNKINKIKKKEEKLAEQTKHNENPNT